MTRKLIFTAAALTLSAFVTALEYRSDNGVPENGIGLNQGGNFAWMQQFSVTGGNDTITSISTTFGGIGAPPNSSGVTAGQAFKVYLWKGTPTGVGVDAPTLIAQATGSVSAGSIDTNVFQSVAINGVISGTSNFFIGASVNHDAGMTPAGLQETGSGPWPILDNSWVAGSLAVDGFDPNNLTGGVGLFKNSSAQVDLPGNWMLRAEATSAPVPEPMTMTAFAAALGAMAMRRRRKS